ncbi:uncharacterized protein N7443_010824 [Penicillium atrosanguineum]|uniref:uncharacterized protein n=1 Tax=Penicillium atrosanguineum TaxID=1132637 RepID=UPI0023A466B1|nr:uncharacterized protein N7443_010824 [Penicillium atrosanguineum]KAJ5290571.1 hypothetical protein N7443_010824 [Penicillium atrosanguineum]
MHPGRTRPDRVAPHGEAPLGMPNFISGIRSALEPDEYGVVIRSKEKCVNRSDFLDSDSEQQALSQTNE